MSVRRVLGSLRDGGSGRAFEEHLLAMGTAAVLARAVPLGDTLVLPGLVVFTLPAEDLRRFRSPRRRDGLARALQMEVSRRCGHYRARRRRAEGAQVRLLGGDGLRVGLVEGDVREVEARFLGRAAAGLSGIAGIGDDADVEREERS